MAVTVLEAPESRELESGRSNSASQRYIIYQTEAGVGDEEVARDALIATAPASIGLLVVGSARVSETERADFWLGTVEYVPPGKLDREKAPPATNDSTFNFDTGGGTQRITQSKENKGLGVWLGRRSVRGPIPHEKTGRRSWRRPVRDAIRMTGFVGYFPSRSRARRAMCSAVRP